jgi:phosphatidylglycerophosphate synthase
MSSPPLNRRPLKSRDTRWANAGARWLAAHGVRPNYISLLSLLFAALAGAAFLSIHRVSRHWEFLPYLAAAISIQLRLLCNLLDGMVAIEGGFRSKSGDVFNEFPDRIADALILAPAGYSLDLPFGRELGWTAALLAVLTAYVRALGASLGLPQDFCGPMAKPHRMAVITAGCVAGAVESWIADSAWPLAAALAIVAAGSLVTVARRAVRLVRRLEGL